MDQADQDQIGDGDDAGGEEESRLVVNPANVSFGAAPVDTDATRTVSLEVIGVSDLYVRAVSTEGASAFSVIVAGKAYSADGHSDLPEPLRIRPGEPVEIPVVFLPRNPGEMAGTVRFHLETGVVVLALGGVGVVTGACLEASPEVLMLPTTPVGGQATGFVTMTGCGTQPLKVVPDLVPGSHLAFGLPAPGPLELLPGGSGQVEVRFAPVSIAHELFEETVGTLRMAYAGGEQALVPLRGGIVAGDSAVAVIDVVEGAPVLAGQALHLSGERSWAPNGIGAWSWAFSSPAGPQIGTSAAMKPLLDVPVPGVWTIRLAVEDAESAAIAETVRTIEVLQPGVLVTLQWRTPADPDESDDQGANLDLHLLHPFASGQDLDEDGTPDGWYDQPFDCFWFNPAPNWGSFDPAADDDPHLDNDDTAGGGPETIRFAEPELGRTYRIGVHAYGDHAFGTSYATVRVYVEGTLAYEEADVPLLPWDLWEVARIEWPAGGVSPVRTSSGERLIAPDYHNPFF